MKLTYAEGFIRRWLRRGSLPTLTACLWLLAGCAVGPDYHAPKLSVPPSWLGTDTNLDQTVSAAVPSVPNASPAAATNWWAAFNDPVLAVLVTRAVETNLDLKLAESRIRQARAQRMIVTGALWPSLDASGDYRHSRQNSGALSDVNVYQAGLDAAWELDIFGGTRRAVEAANADIAASVEDRRDVAVTLMAEVALNYIGLRGLQQEIAIAKENLAAQTHSMEITRQRFRGGFIGKLDVANAEAQVATTQSQIPVLEASARQAIYALSLLLAQEPGALVEQLAPEGVIPLVPPDVPVGLPAELLRRRPDIRRAEAQLQGATARVGIATAELFPKFSLTGSLGVSDNKTSSLVNWDNRFYSVGPTVTWALFRAGAIRAGIKVQNALEEQALLTYQKAVLTALNDVERALVAYVREQQHRLALTEAVAANQEAVKLATQLYAQGETDFLSVLIAQRALFAVQDAHVQSERAVATDLVAVYKALGGGWQLTPSWAADGFPDPQ